MSCSSRLPDILPEPPEGYDIVVTEDGSHTLYSKLFEETCHSTSGARDETRHVYVEGSGLIELMQRQAGTLLLEVGFGLGVGLKTTVDEIHARIPNCQNRLVYLSLEKDRALVEWVLRDYSTQKIGDQYRFSIGTNIEVVILVGDAREQLLSLPGILAQENASLDVIYQDPFSPKKNPELWTTDWFEKLKKLSRPGTVLCTYSASSAVRKALGAAGWTVQSFAGFARKKQSTKAFL